MSENTMNENKRKNKRRNLIIAIVIIVLAGGAVASCLCHLFVGKSEKVEFETLSRNKIPQKITTDVIPEYRGTERALACEVGGEIYVMASRGEKPTSGFTIKITGMTLKKEKNKTTLIVDARFKDPKEGVVLSQVITYPVEIARTNLKTVPDSIEMQATYE